MATSPIYSWPEPDNTDLVKNGALAIRTLGNAIDTTMGTMTPKSTYTAKGSIAAATAASTPANLSVGADYGFLQALASESTGLQWNSAAWTTYTPTITAGTGTYTTVSGTGRYIRIGKACLVQQQVTVTTNGTAATEVRVTLPFTGISDRNIGAGREVNVTGNMLQGEVNTTYIGWRNYNNTYPLGSNYTMYGTAIYEVA
jgi:hypothetical protein